MSSRRDRLAVPALLAAALSVLLAPDRAWAQGNPTARLAASAVVMERPRGDSVVIGRLEAGAGVELLDRDGVWYLVRPVEIDAYDWREGWIHQQSLRTPGLTAADRRRPPGRAARPPAQPWSIRGFAQVGGIFFTAADTFQAVLENSRGLLWGGGGQVALGNGVYFQGTIERIEKTGTRALALGEDLFTFDQPAAATITPALFTVGQRALGLSRFVPYVGGGVGLYRLRESSAAAGGRGIDERHVGYHVVGGTEYRLHPWLSLAGEVQWASVPGGLGDSGASRILDEDDLGGTTLRFKVLVGR